MTIGHDALLGFVARVNGPLALISWPFALYEVFAKNPGIPHLKEKLDLRRSQMLGSVVLDLVEKLMPYWPRTSSRIILEPRYEDDQPPSLSNDAIDEMKVCLESHEDTLYSAMKIRRICGRVLKLDGLCYGLIFAIALESLTALIAWFFFGSMSDRLALALISIPISTAFLALICAGFRQSLIHAAHRIIVSVED